MRGSSADDDDCRTHHFRSPSANDFISRSDALDRNFRDMLWQRLELLELPEGSRLTAGVYRRAIADFEKRIRTEFRNNGQKWAVELWFETEFPAAGIEDGYLTLTNEDILLCFQPIVEEILELLWSQISAIKGLGKIVHVS